MTRRGDHLDATGGIFTDGDHILGRPLWLEQIPDILMVDLQVAARNLRRTSSERRIMYVFIWEASEVMKS